MRTSSPTAISISFSATLTTLGEESLPSFLHLKHVADVQGIENLYANVSITARPFFERMGFSVLEEQHVNVRGQVLKNYRMVADFTKN